MFIMHSCGSRSPQPGQLRQDTSFLDYCKRRTLKACMFHLGCAMFSRRVPIHHCVSVRLRIRFRYCGVDLGIAESICLLRSRFWYCSDDCGITVSILVLQTPIWYYKIDSCIIESIFVLQSRLLHHRVGLRTTESMFVITKYFLVLWSRF